MKKQLVIINWLEVAVWFHLRFSSSCRDSLNQVWIQLGSTLSLPSPKYQISFIIHYLFLSFFGVGLFGPGRAGPIMAIAAAAVVVPLGLLFFTSGLLVNLIQVSYLLFLSQMRQQSFIAAHNMQMPILSSLCNMSFLLIECKMTEKDVEVL